MEIIGERDENQLVILKRPEFMGLLRILHKHGACRLEICEALGVKNTTED